MVKTDTWCSSRFIDKIWHPVQSSNYHGEDHAIYLFTLYNNDSVFTYEFYPRKDSLPSSFYLSLLRGTRDDSEENNLYPCLHLLPDGNLSIFANKRSISFDYMNNKVVKEFHTCRRLKLTDLNLVWSMETMSMPHVMPDMLLLPINDVVFINGANHSTVGSNDAKHSNFNQILMMYHSSVVLLSNGRILVDGSNPHEKYNFTLHPYPTNLRSQSILSTLLVPHNLILRPTITSMDAIVSYNQNFFVTFKLPLYLSEGKIYVSLVTPSFTTYSFAMNQQMVVLNVVNIERTFMTTYQIVVNGPLPRRWHYLGII
ncbi:hypothetical protein CISIN_1g043929mg [Citrus sinensis]|uniref:Uncharacterized protein n=1 Tax=Citrus sinensis TaxID=2711 RepID=A0A067G3C1_CITSI|nr:hypothetical protein CISIN_1g043929mg [Citrus sinensis]